MKIVYCINQILPMGGREQVTQVKLNALAEIPSNEIYVVVTDHDYEKTLNLHPKVQLIDLDVNYYEDDWKTGYKAKFNQLIKILKHFFALRKTLNILKPDVVVSTGLSEKFFANKIFQRKKNRIFVREFHSASNYRSILSNHSPSFVTRILEILDLKLISRSYDAIFTLTSEDLEANWKQAKNAYVMPNPLTTPFPAQINPLESREKLIISIGRLTPEKNHIDLLKSFCNIADKYINVKLIILGEGQEKSNLQKFIDSNNLQDRVYLAGWQRDVTPYLEKSALLVHSSLMEGFPLVFLEAMSYGLPVISYDCPYGPSDIIEDNRTGFIVKMQDIQDLSSAIERILQDDNRRVKFGFAAREKSRKFLPDAIAREWMDVFTNLTMRHK